MYKGRKHYIGEKGTTILVDCGRDIDAATFVGLKVVKPNGDIVEWSGTKYTKDGITRHIKHTIVEGELDQAGKYKVQAQIALHGYVGPGETDSFMVFMPFA